MQTQSIFESTVSDCCGQSIHEGVCSRCGQSAYLTAPINAVIAAANKIITLSGPVRSAYIQSEAVVLRLQRESKPNRWVYNFHIPAAEADKLIRFLLEYLGRPVTLGELPASTKARNETILRYYKAAN